MCYYAFCFVLLCFSQNTLLIVKEFRVWSRNVGISSTSIVQAAGRAARLGRESSHSDCRLMEEGLARGSRSWQGHLEGCTYCKGPGAPEGSSRGGTAWIHCHADPGKEQSWAGGGHGWAHWGAPATPLPPEGHAEGPRRGRGAVSCLLLPFALSISSVLGECVVAGAPVRTRVSPGTLLIVPRGSPMPTWALQASGHGWVWVTASRVRRLQTLGAMAISMPTKRQVKPWA